MWFMYNYLVNPPPPPTASFWVKPLKGSRNGEEMFDKYMKIVTFVTLARICIVYSVVGTMEQF